MKRIHRAFIYTDPAPTCSCHASTLAVLGDGSVCTAWFGGTAEKNNDVRIYVSRLENDVWSAPLAVSPDDGVPHWNPVLFQTDDTTLTLYYKRGYEIRDWQTMVTVSCDGGRTWCEPSELICGDESGGRGPVKNKPIRGSNGKLLAPASVERGPWRCFIDIFDGGNWTKHPIPVVSDDAAKINMIQPTLWESAPGHIHALMRSNRGLIYRSDSRDGGETWCAAYATEIPNNNSGIDCVRTANGTLVLVCNPDMNDWGKRYPLSIFTSTDNGNTFVHAIDLETEAGEFSYPAVVAQDERIFLTYTWNRKKIVYCELELQQIDRNGIKESGGIYVESWNHEFVPHQ